jgi:hypothetical protein
MHKTKNMLSRRRLLTGLAAGVVAAPLASTLLSSIVRADTGQAPLRFFLMFTGNGQVPSHWLPTGGETTFTLSPVLAPLEPFKHKLLLAHGLKGLNHHAGGMSETTTGWGSPDDSGVPENGPSIDQFLADAWRGETPLSSIELGVMPTNRAFDQTSYSATGMPLPAIGSALGGFQRIFDVTNLSPEEAERRRALKASVVDLVKADLEGLHGRLGASARVLLDEHLTLVREHEKSLKEPLVPLSCDLPEAPVGTGMVSTWKAQNDNIVAAFRCGVTRVATLRAGGYGGIESGGYHEIGVSGGHHAISHTGPDASLIAINNFHAQQLAYLIGQLDAIPEGDGTLLDNTVVVWVNELGLGPWNSHARSDQHVVLAGGKNAGLRNGAFLNLGGTDYQHFLFTLTQLMGQTQITKFGHHGSQVISQLFA